MDVDCDFYAVENAWQVTFWTVEGRAPLLVVKHTEGASEAGYERCPECEHATKGAPRDAVGPFYDCLLYTSPSPRDKRQSRMPSSA